MSNCPDVGAVDSKLTYREKESKKKKQTKLAWAADVGGEVQEKRQEKEKRQIFRHMRGGPPFPGC